MGREKVSGKLGLVDLDHTPLPGRQEFALIRETNFTVPFDTIKLVDTKAYHIPGLWTPEVAVREKYLSQVNVFPVTVKYFDPVYPQTCIVVKGRTSIGELSDLIHSKMELHPLDEVEILVDGKLLPNDKLLLSVNKESVGSDGFVEVFCRVAVWVEEN